MSLTTIAYGAVASSAVINDNFVYLDDRIDNVSATQVSDKASLESQIIDLNSNLSDTISTVSATVATISGTLASVFDTLTTVSGTLATVSGTAYIVESQSTLSASGYILYSNGYCEQWGVATANSVSFGRLYTDIPAVICMQIFFGNTGSIGNPRVPIYVSETGFTVGNTASATIKVIWRAWGMTAVPN